MIRINLLPIKVSRRQEAVRREIMVAALGLVGLLLACTVLYLLQAANLNSVKAANAAIQSDLDQLRVVVARVDEVEKVNDELRRKLSVIEGLQAQKVGPVHMLDELSMATPEKLSLTSMKEISGRITLMGVAASNEVISQFLMNLEKSPWLDEVYLIRIDQHSKSGVNLKNFEITARMVVEKQKQEARRALKARAAGGGDVEDRDPLEDGQ